MSTSISHVSSQFEPITECRGCDVPYMPMSVPPSPALLLTFPFTRVTPLSCCSLQWLIEAAACGQTNITFTFSFLNRRVRRRIAVNDLPFLFLPPPPSSLMHCLEIYFLSNFTRWINRAENVTLCHLWKSFYPIKMIRFDAIRIMRRWGGA